MRIRAVLGLATVSIVIAAISSPVRAVEVCYDYVWFRVTLSDPDPKGAGRHYLNRAALEKELRKRHYTELPTVPSGSHLKFRDVIFVPGHVGFANGPNNIDHFIILERLEENSINQDTVYDAEALPQHLALVARKGPFFRGGLYKGDPLEGKEGFLSRPSRPATSYVVWRAPDIAGDWNGTWAQGTSTFVTSVSAQTLTVKYATLYPPESFDQHGGTGKYTCPRLTADVATCTWKGEYHDPAKALKRSGTATLRLDNNAITGTSFEGQPTATRGSAEGSSMRAGAKWTANWTRKT